MAAIKTVQNQIFTGDGKEFTTVSFTVRKPESQWDNSLEFGKCCEDLSWNHGTSTPYRSETNGVAARVVRRIQEGTSAVLLQSGLDEKWWADTMAGYCYLWNVQDLLSDEKTPYERRFGDPFKGPGIPFGSMVEYHPFLRKTSPHSINLVRKFYLQHSSDMHCLRVRIWKGDLMVADIGELENLDASEIHAGSLIAKTVFMPKNGEDGTFHVVRKSTSIPDYPERDDVHNDDLRGETDGSKPWGTLTDDTEAGDDIWTIAGNYINRHQVDPRV